MKKQLLRFTLYVIIIYLTGAAFNLAIAASQPAAGNGTHYCGVTDVHSNKQHSDQYPNRRYARTFAANLNVGKPRTVRMIYFLPNDWPYRADVVQKMKDDIRTAQTFYAEQMEAHGYGEVTFRFETDLQGEPMVHRVDGQHPFSHYDNTLGTAVLYELEQTFDLDANIYFIVLGTDALRQGNGQPAGGVGRRRSKNGGDLLVPNGFSWATVAHELGHAFGLGHDFRDDVYIMSYGGEEHRSLSVCAAEFLSVHSYFNPDTPIEEEQLPTIELISPRTYPADSKSVTIRFQVNDSEGLHQVLLSSHGALNACRGLDSKRDGTVEFEYNGDFGLDGFTVVYTSLSDSATHPIYVEVVDTDGNVSSTFFTLAESSPHHVATLEGHTDSVRSVSFSPDGTLASGSIDETVRLWDVETRQNIATLEEHTHWVESVSFSLDGTLASGSGDGTVMLWDVGARQNIATLTHGAWVDEVSFSPDGTTLASGGGVGWKVKLWDVATETNFATLMHEDFVLAVSFSDAGSLASGGDDRTVKLWDVATETDFATLTHEEVILSVAFSPDGTILASGGWGGIELWDVATRQNIGTLTHGGVVSSVSFSLDGGTLASGGWDGTVKLWDMTTRTNFVTLPHTSVVYSVSFSLDGGTLASGTSGGTVELWDTSGLMGVRLEATAEIDIPDPNLRAAIAEAIGLPPNTPIFWGHLGNLTRLDARNANISDLTGLEGATNLRTLDLGAEYVEAENRSINSNSVSDLSPLTGLTKLRTLFLQDSNISDISTVAGLTSLTRLYLGNNNVSDISAVSGLTNLRELNVDNNSISDILSVAGLTDLTYLYLNGNNVSDISAISGLTNLRTLNLGGNSILDISAIAGLTHLTNLTLWNNLISDISAVAGLTNLTYLNVHNNSVSDISSVAGLTNLRYLGLGGNSVSDISAVAGLTNLTDLSLWNNSVSDISAVSGLTNLTSLNLGGNSVSDISAVAGLTDLTELNVHNNSVSDISSVAGLTNLARLNLNNNAISDVSPLLGLNLTGTSWDSTGLYLERNPLSYVSINTHIPAIQAKGVEVKFDSRTATTLLNISGVITASDNVLTIEVRDSNGRIFEGVPVTFAVISGGGTLSVTNTTTDKKGRAQSTLTLGKESNRVTVSAVRAEQTATFSDVAEAGVHIPDPNLRAAIEDVLGVKSGSPISPEEMATLTYLRAREASIGVLIGLESATNLTELRLGNNGITDISPLSGLTNLRTLGLGRNSVTDISPLSGLTNLRTLGLSNNGIKDVSALVSVLSGLINLTELHLRDNRITDISSLAGLTNLTNLRLGNNQITNISSVAGLTNLTNLRLGNNQITNISSLAGLTNLTNLRLGNNQITNISHLSGLTHLTELRLSGNRITDISPLSGLTNLRTLDLPNGIQDLPALVQVLSRLTHLTSLGLSNNGIKDVSALVSVLSDLTDLRDLNLSGSGITDLSPLAELTNLTGLTLWGNNISDISPVADLTNLRSLGLGNNSISDISPLAELINLTSLNLWNNNISDLSPLVENTGLGSQDWSWVGVRENPLSYQSIHTHIPALQSRGVTVDSDNQAHPTFLIISGENQRRLPGETLAYPFVVEARDENGSPFAGVSVTFAVTGGGGTLSIHTTTTDANGRAESTLTLGPNFGTNTVFVSAAGIPVSLTFHAIGDNPEFLWSIPSGYSLIHAPLKVTAVDGVPMTIRSIADLYDALGGADTVTYLLTLDSQTQEWFGYFRASDRDTPADRGLTDDMGILARLITPVSVRLTGSPLGTNGTSTITLNPGYNLVGLPLRDSRVRRVSHLFALEGIGGNIPAIIFTDNGEFKAVIPAGGPGDIPIIGGQAFMLDAQQAATVAVSGDGWYNTSETAAAPLLSLKGIEVGDTTPVLGLRGSIVDEGMGTNSAGFRVIVKNLSTGRAVATVTKDENYSRPDKQKSERVGYQVVIVDVETGRAAQIGDILEISVRSPSPLIGVQPLRYTVTAEDVKRGLIQLTELVAYEIPTETELLHNYPNPFNPETWIPYRLAEDAFVTLTIYDLNGHVVRTFDVGHQIASVYESRSKAVYWDGRNGVGEQVASGVYFYTLTGGDYFATRKMVILK